MILYLKGNKLGKVCNLYFLSFWLQIGIKHYKLNKAALRRTNLLFPPTPGPTTTERILELIHHNPQGMTITELEQQLNRPVSMLQICLKGLMADKLIKKRKQGMQLIYYPNHAPN